MPTTPSSSKRPDWLSPAGLAKLHGCSERTIREWCNHGVIREVYRTKGGHWRIPMPLSGKTRYELEKRHDDSPLHGDDRLAAFAPDLAEWLLLAQLFQLPLDQNVPAPTIAEWGDPLWEGVVDENLDRARKIQEEIIRRLVAGESFSDLMLLGWVYQFWLENQRCPTVTEIAERMGLSRQAFYRRHSRAELYRAYLIASGRVGTYLLDPEGLDEVELANRKAKKPRGPNLNRDA